MGLAMSQSVYSMATRIRAARDRVSMDSSVIVRSGEGLC